MEIRKYTKKDAKECSILIQKTIKLFNKEDLDKNSTKRYLNMYDINHKDWKHTEKEFNSDNIFFVAIENKNIIWIIRWNKNKITNLFVDKNYHKKWIWKKLLIIFEDNAKIQWSNFIKISSSTYAKKFYEKNWYKITSQYIIKSWLKFRPMEKKL